MQIPVPPTITQLTKTIDSAPKNPSVNEALSAASSALLAYNELPAESKAAYLLRLRQERAQLLETFAGVMRIHVANHLTHPTPESAAMAGQLAMQAGDPQGAANFFAEQAELSSDSGEQASAYASQGEALLKSAGGRHGVDTERVDLAMRLFQKAAELQPDITLTKKRAVEKIVSKGATGPTSDFNAEGLKQLLAGNIRGAKRAFELAVEHDPDNAECLNNLSLTCSYAGQFGRAAKLAMRALKLNPGTNTNNLIFATACMQAVIDECK